jgi:hypothetical protein
MFGLRKIFITAAAENRKDGIHFLRRMKEFRDGKTLNSLY